MKLGTREEIIEKEKETPKEEVTQDWVVDHSKKKEMKKKEKTPNDTNKKESKKSTIILGAVLGLLVLLGGAFLFIKGRQPKQVDDGPKEVVRQVSPSEDILNAVNTMYNNGALIGVQIDPEESLSIMYYFDHNGKAYAESPYINGLFIDKDKSLTEKQDGNGEYYFGIADDMTPLYMIETMVNIANSGKGKIQDITVEDEKAVNCKSYQVDIVGEDIASVFGAVSEDYCSEQIKTLYDLNNKNLLKLSDILRLMITIGEGDGQVAAAIFVVRDNTPYILYNFEGYTSIGGWDLDAEKWNKDMDVNSYKEMRADYHGVQTFCGAQIEKWLTAHPDIVNSIGNRMSTSESSSNNVGESSEAETNTEAK